MTKFKSIEVTSKDGQPISGTVPYEIWDDFKDLLEIERRKGNRSLKQWQFLLLIMKEGMKSWLKSK